MSPLCQYDLTATWCIIVFPIFSYGNLKGRDHAEDLGVDGKMKLE